MKKNNSHQVWIDTGYSLFAEEGHEGLQIERLARITGLNKSGFYHYFGDLEGFFNQLIREHERLVDALIEPMSKLKSYDPEYLELLIQNKRTSFFQIQLVRNRHIKIFIEAHVRINKRLAHIVTPLFSKEMGLTEEAAYPYYELMRDMFYVRVDYNTFTYEFLHAIVEKFKNMVPIIKGSQP